MDSPTLRVVAALLALLVIYFAAKALLGAPSRERWRRLAAEIGLTASTFAGVHMSGVLDGYYTTAERYRTPDPRHPGDGEADLWWWRIAVRIEPARACEFMFGRATVLNHAAGFFAKRLSEAQILPAEEGWIPRLFLKEACDGLVLELIADEDIRQAINVLPGTWFFETDGSQLSYSELGIKVLDKDHIKASVERFRQRFALLMQIAGRMQCLQRM